MSCAALNNVAEGFWLSHARVQVIEFESNAMMIGHLGLRVSLIAYPVVSVKKVRPPIA